jgi:glyoxylase-like metal-dependent hydrolase (beta-lactamase superfamily II)
MSAPLSGTLRPDVHRFKLGNFEVTTILDGTMMRDSVKPPFCIDQSDATVTALARANLLPSNAFENNFIPTLVNTGDQLVLFDVGNGSMRHDVGAGHLVQLLPKAGFKPEDVDTVVFTHVHPDHIGGLYEGDNLAFPNARYLIGRVEFDEWRSGARIPPQREDNRNLFIKLVVPLADQMSFLDPGNEIVPGIRAVEAYGHSLGHMAYLIESDGKTCLIWGDVTNHSVFSLQNPQWQAGFDDDKAKAVETRKRILDMCATDELLVVGHHMPFPGVGYVERAGDGYRWLPLSYQLRV